MLIVKSQRNYPSNKLIPCCYPSHKLLPIAHLLSYLLSTIDSSKSVLPKYLIVASKYRS